MAAHGLQQPNVFQGTKLPWHDCVLTARWFMLLRGGGAIVEKGTHVFCDLFRGLYYTGSKWCLTTDFCVRFDIRGDHNLCTGAHYPERSSDGTFVTVLMMVVDRVADSSDVYVCRAISH